MWFVYAFECRICGALCSSERSAGATSYSLREGLHLFHKAIPVHETIEQQKENEGGAIVEERNLAKCTRERAEKSSTAAASERSMGTSCRLRYKVQ